MRHALAQQHVILADHHADRHGSTVLAPVIPREQLRKGGVRQVVLGDESDGAGAERSLGPRHVAI
jgi:hypothetical protein